MLFQKVAAITIDRTRLRIIIGIILAFLVLVSYHAVVKNDFVAFDDPEYVTQNYRIQRGLSIETALWALKTNHLGNWHPLTWYSLLLDRELYWKNAGGYHWTSVLLHLMAGLFLFLALTEMTRLPWHSGLVAALFLIHPLHVESVAWVSERKDVLSGLFWMMGLWCYARYARRPGKLRYLWVAVTFVLGLMSKPMAVTFPFVLLLLDWWPLGRAADGKSNWKRLVLEKIPLFVLSAVISVVTFLSQKAYNAMPPLSVMSFGDRFANATASYAKYLLKTVWPTDLTIFYPYHGPPRISFLIASIILLTVITLVSVILAKNKPYLIVGWLWYLGMLVPVIGIVQVGAQEMADRYTYLPLVGIFIMAVWGARDICGNDRRRKIIYAFASTAVLGILVFLTQIQVGYWKNNTTLFRHALRNTKMNYMAYYLIGEEKVKTGDLKEAERYYRISLRIRSKFKLAHNGIGYLMMIQGKQDEAAKYLEEALKIDPKYVLAMKNLGSVRMCQQRIDDAVSLYREALDQAEGDWELVNNYGVALYAKGESEDAAKQFKEALRLKPDYAEARDNLRKIQQNRVGSGKGFFLVTPLEKHNPRNLK